MNAAIWKRSGDSAFVQQQFKDVTKHGDPFYSDVHLAQEPGIAPFAAKTGLPCCLERALVAEAFCKDKSQDSCSVWVLFLYN